MVALCCFVLAVGCGGGGTDSTSSLQDVGGSDPTTDHFAPALGVNLAAMTKLSRSLYIQDVTPGTGTAAAANDSLSVTYTGWLVDGTQFDSNVGKTPLNFRLGTGAVIVGWDKGLVGMRAGGTRRLVIGSTFGYGTVAKGVIPSNSTLVFDVQLLSVH